MRGTVMGVVGVVMAAVLPAGAAESAGGEPAASYQVVRFGPFEAEVPAAWRVVPPANPMRVLQLAMVVKGSEAAPVDLVVYHFPGSGGGVEANIERWIGQFRQPDGSDSHKAARIEKHTPGGLKVTTVKVSGTYTAAMGPMMRGGAEKPNHTMFGAVIEHPEGHYFLKAVGPTQQMKQHERAWAHLIGSLRRQGSKLAPAGGG